jgi:hypothetical protein
MLINEDRPICAPRALPRHQPLEARIRRAAACVIGNRSMAKARRPAQVDTAKLVADFVNSLSASVEAATAARIKAAILKNLSGAATVRTGRPLRSAVQSPADSKRTRRRQLCPVPGCKNPAAPVFGMVCAKHQNVSKAKIKEYRADLRRHKGPMRLDLFGRAPMPQASKSPKKRAKFSDKGVFAHSGGFGSYRR